MQRDSANYDAQPGQRGGTSENADADAQIESAIHEQCKFTMDSHSYRTVYY